MPPPFQSFLESFGESVFYFFVSVYLGSHSLLLLWFQQYKGKKNKQKKGMLKITIHCS